MTEVISLAAIAGCYCAIIAMYRWSDNEMDHQRDSLDTHVRDATKHTPSSDLVFRDVCDERVKRIELAQQKIVEEVRLGFADIKEAIKDKHGH